MKYLFFVLATLISTAALADPPGVKIPWKGDYPHNSSKLWSKANPYDSGFSKNFKNGTPQEFGDVQKEGELNAFVYSPKDAKGPVPFVVVMHGCDGMSTAEKEWTARVADALNKEGFGALVLDSYSTRYVDNSCGLSDLHWARRRADDAYSALDYLIEKKLTKANEVYITGYSNGGTTALVSMTTQESDHPHHFAAAFAVAPGCSPSLQHSALYTGPILIFMGDKDDANNPEWCRELTKKKRSVSVQMIEYQGANHGFVLDVPSHVGDHGWALTYNPVAEKDMMQTIISTIKAKKFAKGLIVRQTGTETKIAPTSGLSPAELWKLQQN